MIDETDFDGLVGFFSLFESAEELEDWYNKVDKK